MCSLNDHDKVVTFNISNGYKLDVCLHCNISIGEKYKSFSNPGRDRDPIETGGKLSSHSTSMRFNGLAQYSQQAMR